MRKLFKLLLLCLMVSPAYAGPNLLGDINIASLKNLSGAAIYVTGHDSHSQSAGITVSDVGNIVQRHFRLIGLKSISYEAAEKDPRYPAFVVHINVFRNTMDSSYSYSLEFRQNVNLTSSPGLKLHVPTWSLVVKEWLITVILECIF